MRIPIRITFPLIGYEWKPFVINGVVVGLEPRLEADASQIGKYDVSVVLPSSFGEGLPMVVDLKADDVRRIREMA